MKQPQYKTPKRDPIFKMVVGKEHVADPHEAFENELNKLAAEHFLLGARSIQVEACFCIDRKTIHLALDLDRNCYPYPQIACFSLEDLLSEMINFSDDEVADNDAAAGILEELAKKLRMRGKSAAPKSHKKSRSGGSTKPSAMSHLPEFYPKDNHEAP